MQDKTIIGWVDNKGSVGVTSYDHDDGSLQDTTLAAYFADDDHVSPGIYVRDDGRLVVFWCAHVSSGPAPDTMRWKISDSAADISSFGPENTFTASDDVDYPQPVSWGDDLRLYYRYGTTDTSAWVYRDSTDGGDSFGSEQPLADFSGNSFHYIHPYADGDRLHFAMGDHRMVDTGIYHWYLEDGDYYTSDGTQIAAEGTELTDITNITQVYDGTASGNNPTKQYDLICGPNGNPHVAFVEHVSTGSGGGDGDYRARWAKWDDTEWIVGSEITEMGGALPEENYYEGGLSLDSQDPTTVYVSVEADDRNYQIQEWSTDDDGSTWTKVQNLSPADATLTDPTKRARPISPRNHDGSDLAVMWWAGYYDYFEDHYKTQIRHNP